MTKPATRNAVEIHGCIVCARLFNVLAVYASDDRLVDCVVTSPGGHIVPDEKRPLVACDTHTAEEVESAHMRRQSLDRRVSNNEEDED